MTHIDEERWERLMKGAVKAGFMGAGVYFLMLGTLVLLTSLGWLGQGENAPAFALFFLLAMPGLIVLQALGINRVFSEEAPLALLLNVFLFFVFGIVVRAIFSRLSRLFSN